jgi:positive regulator of sigma E activity
MTHLSTNASIMAMIFYSLLTFFLGPLVTRPFMKDHPDQCIAGFLLGFTVSVFLWMKYGRKLAKMK